jgi:Hydroxyacylglutathione hydrolase C-terminus
MYLIPVAAFADHCLWLLPDDKGALMTNPGDSGAVMRTFAQRGRQLQSILVMHHFAAHTAGTLCDGKQPGLLRSIAQKLLTNLFLRTRQTPLLAAVCHFDAPAQDNNTVFATIRQWKNQFK